MPPRTLAVAMGNVGLKRSPRLGPPIVPVEPLAHAARVVSVLAMARALPVTIHLVKAVAVAITRLIVAACAGLAAVH